MFGNLFKRKKSENIGSKFGYMNQEIKPPSIDERTKLYNSIDGNADIVLNLNKISEDPYQPNLISHEKIKKAFQNRIKEDWQTLLKKSYLKQQNK